MNIFKYKGRWGIEERDEKEEGKVCLVYDASLTKRCALRIVALETSDDPPADWEATREILEREGFTEKDFEKITQ